MTVGLLPSVALLGAVAAALATCVYLFATLKRECADQRRSAAEAAAALVVALRDLQARTAHVERELEGAPAMPAGATGMNLNRRTQALRLMRKGEAPDRIAAALSLPVAEVELLSKLNQIATEQVTSSRSATA